jgi:hypothetical protein|tara:strand:- start:243 stop:416 length:174 start_codon:yes stop_codon:yes gene_type:complete
MITDRKKVLFIQNNLGEDSAFMEMLKHLCEDSQDAISRKCPERMLKELTFVLQKIGD